MHNFNISICYKSRFSGLQTIIKVTFFILHHLLRCVSPLCFPVVFPRFWVEVLKPAFPLHSSTIWDVTYPRNKVVLR